MYLFYTHKHCKTTFRFHTHQTRKLSRKKWSSECNSTLHIPVVNCRNRAKADKNTILSRLKWQLCADRGNSIFICLVWLIICMSVCLSTYLSTYASQVQLPIRLTTTPRKFVWDHKSKKFSILAQNLSD